MLTIWVRLRTCCGHLHLQPQLCLGSLDCMETLQQTLQVMDNKVWTRDITMHTARKDTRICVIYANNLGVKFIDALVESQGRDMKFLSGVTCRNVGEELQTDFYIRDWTIAKISMKADDPIMDAKNGNGTLISPVVRVRSFTVRCSTGAASTGSVATGEMEMVVTNF
nr:hypothetical protein [Tanacetum cinerariifolium]